MSAANEFRSWGRRLARRLSRPARPGVESRGSTRRVLCLVHGGIGDRLMTLPALRLVRAAYPSAYLCVAWCGEAIPGVAGEANETLVVSRNGLLAQWRLMRRGWDLLFVNSIGMHSATTEVAVALARVPFTIGPLWPELPGTVYDRTYAVDPGIHVTATNCRALDATLPTAPVAYPVDIGMQDSENDTILFHVGCRLAYPGYERNRWPLEKFIRLAEELRKAARDDVAVLLGPDEPHGFDDRLHGRGIRSIRPGSLAELFGVIARSALLVGNDSGPSHIAAAVGTPEVILFGPSNPRRSAPVSDRALLICARDGKPRRYADLPEHVPADMNLIEVPVVRDAVLQLLATYRSRRVGRASTAKAD